MIKKTQSIKKWKKVCNNMAAFLNSSKFIKPEMEDENMIKCVPLLQKINKLGFLTENSQRGSITQNPNKTITIERAYLNGLMPLEQAKIFIKKFNISGNQIAYYMPIFHMNKKQEQTVIDLMMPVTITLNRKNKLKQVDSRQPTTFPHYVSEGILKAIHLSPQLYKNLNIVHIICIDPVWKRIAESKNGLFTNVCHVLQNLY
jgi:hypothetical protein